MTTAAVSYQQGKPAHWNLAEEVTLPGGRRLRGTLARVYEVLRLAQATRHVFRIGEAFGPPGEVPTWVFREPWCGGSAGARRLRDLAKLVGIEGRAFNPGGTSADSQSWVWRLKGDSPQAEASPGRSPQASGRPAMKPPLHGVTIHLRAERPALWSGQLIDISPGLSHRAAPTASLCQLAQRRELEPEQLRALYRKQLLGLYQSGDLARLFQPAAGTPPVLTVCCEAPFPALPVLQRALAALGAAVVPDEEDSAA